MAHEWAMNKADQQQLKKKKKKKPQYNSQGLHIVLCTPIFS